MKSMKPLTMVLVGAFLMLVGATYFAPPAQTVKQTPERPAPPGFEKLAIESKDGGRHAFWIEIADTREEGETGLMFREHMEPDRGMLFELGRTGVVRFWMKNTLIPLDMLFIAPDGTIRKIHENAEPKSLKSISSEVSVSAVLEINGGRAKALGLSAGDRVVHPYFGR
ncbi:MAG: DUF192 domain-containing protein [Pseudomonadota bacterium]